MVPVVTPPFFFFIAVKLTLLFIVDKTKIFLFCNLLSANVAGMIANLNKTEPEKNEKWFYLQ